jgi:hypothetical protein
VSCKDHWDINTDNESDDIPPIVFQFG